MQRVAAYRLESVKFEDSRRTADYAASVRELVKRWLETKGAAPDGTYRSHDNSDATYHTAVESHAGRSWEFVELVETTEHGRRFVASLSVTVTEEQVLVYVTLEVGTSSSQVNMVPVDARCPSIVRSLMADAGPWFHGASEVVGLHSVEGFPQGEALAAELVDPHRRVPVVVVSSGGPPALVGLDKQLAFDLAGIGNVVAVDVDASWALTDVLGLACTCHSGAVRTYWPGLTRDSNPYRHPLWTARRILSTPGGQAIDTLRRQLRRIIMSASAISVVRPAVIDEIRTGAALTKFDDLRASAASVDEWKNLAEMYADENTKLRGESRSLDAQVSELAGQLRALESDNAALKYQLRSLGQAVQESPEEIEPDFSDQPLAPVQGEVRFYKKMYSTPSHDVLVRIADCGHDRWQNASKADKAKKGVAKLEGGDDWSTVQHCGVCTGGGVWRVKW